MNRGNVGAEMRAQLRQRNSERRTIDKRHRGSDHAASTIRRRCGDISRPSSRGQGSAVMMPVLQGSTNGCAMIEPSRQDRDAARKSMRGIVNSSEGSVRLAA